MVLCNAAQCFVLSLEVGSATWLGLKELQHLILLIFTNKPTEAYKFKANEFGNLFSGRTLKEIIQLQTLPLK